MTTRSRLTIIRTLAVVLAAGAGLGACGQNSGTGATSNATSGAPGGAPSAAKVTLMETGSSLLYPVFNTGVASYQKTNPGAQSTARSTGSGTGISQAISGIAQIGASDAYMSDAQMKSQSGMLNIPLAISSQMVNYNLPGLNNQHLKLSGPVLAGIYNGTVKTWDDRAIATLNPGVRLPHNQIIPVHRTDGSGDTFIFTQFLSFSTPAWSNSTGYGTTVSWPAVQGGIGAEGNAGMVNAARGTPYSIAYIGISFRNATSSAGLGMAQLQNRDGNFVAPEPNTVGAAVNEMASKTPAYERISLIFAPGAQSYPIINYEYAIVKQQQPNAQTATALKDFLNWAINPTGGGADRYLSTVGFVPLPASIRQSSANQIATIRAGNVAMAAPSGTGNARRLRHRARETSQRLRHRGQGTPRRLRHRARETSQRLRHRGQGTPRRLRHRAQVNGRRPHNDTYAAALQ